MEKRFLTIKTIPRTFMAAKIFRADLKTVLPPLLFFANNEEGEFPCN